MVLISVGKSSPMRCAARPHRHIDWELICNLQGHGEMTVDGTVYSFMPGTILLCPPGVLHDKSSEGGFVDYYMKFSDWNVVPAVYCFQDTYDHRLLQLIQVLHSVYYEKRMAQACSSLADALLCLIKPMISGQEQNEYVQMLRHSIVDGFTDPDFSLADAMAAIPVNIDHLRRLFTKDMGITPHSYLTQLRLQKARQLLCEPHSSVADVAYRSGFYDPLYFSKLFRRTMGVAPSRWQKKGDHT